MLEAINNDEADGVVFVKLDRLSRKVRDILQLADKANKDGWHLMSVSEQLDTSTAMGRFVLTLFAALAEMEADRLSERTREAMNGKALRGRARSSKLPFGFRVKGAMKATSLTPGDKRPLVKHDGEQRLLRRIMRLNAKGWGTYRVASYLNNKGTVNPRSGRPWSRQSIRAITTTAKRRAGS